MKPDVDSWWGQKEIASQHSDERDVDLDLGDHHDVDHGDHDVDHDVVMIVMIFMIFKMDPVEKATFRSGRPILLVFPPYIMPSLPSNGKTDNEVNWRWASLIGFENKLQQDGATLSTLLVPPRTSISTEYF